jgi:hypothetical protein
MTLGEAKNKVYMLLDEHSTGGEIEHDRDLELKMVYFFDIAQKMLAQVRKIPRWKTVRPADGREEYPMPADFRSVCRIWRDGRIATGRYHWRRGRLVVPPGDGAKELLVEYYALPETLPDDAPDDYEFELDEAACQCLPYYVAAQQLLPDLVMDYGAMLGMFNQAVNMLAADEPGPAGRVAQTLYS